MQSFKGNLIIFVFILGIAGLANWAFNSMKANNANLIASGGFMEDVGPIVTTEPEVYIPDTTAPIPEPEPEPTPAPTTEEPIGEHATLIKELQKLITDNVLMKKGSKGTRVGTVQKFLIEYGVKVTADNDYGDGTVNGVKKFQAEQKLTADGEAGAGTFKAMISWLEKN